MTSTPQQRLEKSKKLLSILIGDNKEYLFRRRPRTLPSGMNFTNHEWLAINMARTATNNISIKTIFDLEEMVEKYKNPLLMVKLES